MNESTFRRRDFFARMSDGMFGAAFAHLLCQDFFGGTSAFAEQPVGGPEAHSGPAKPFNLTPKPTHHPATAKSVIQLFMNGGPSQMDLFDPKPVLNGMDGKPYPGNVEEIGNTGTAGIGVMMGGKYKFARHGESGMWMADVLPHTAKMADDLCLINSLWTDHPNHDNALYKIHSGRLFMGYPTLGAWTVYGLGSENQNLPAYVVLNDPLGLPKNGTRNWTSGFLPPVFQGTPFRPTGSPILNLKPQYEQPSEVTESARGLLRQLDEIHRVRRPYHPELDARIQSYSLAARMQLSAGEALDIGKETRETLSLYGVGEPETDSFGRRCLLARRLVERGVRFVQIFLEEQPWDSHVDLEDNHRAACRRTDKPVAGLLRDLKRTGLLDSTLVIWGGEFGRTPTSQRAGDVYTGRDHNMQAFSSWIAGGGARGGTTYGKTDEFGHKVVEDPVSVHDFHATLLHLLGLHHQKLFFTRSGLEERLTGVEPPRVVTEILS
ncbi:DUF1501 domain-containing protein [Roseiconus nitratireducens]|uniref:DUF1501 domain-containing protein n=1 Tax=Roseiconus nitratireducens TaxID=2605748 RepID=A0A5M6D990_9BACT|nr:DUF1501 domain-containing protein [Roseiconus nitratireducens]KAA5543050.1 DUF1501 domain-containing protein [Roseiconus nitratireducens]